MKHLIDNLKLKTLQRLAFHCGLPKTGKKGLLADGLQNAVREHEALRAGSRVLSIDMGVRNFAFSLMTPVPSPNSGPLVTLHHWQKVNLLENDDVETLSPDQQPDDVTTAPDFSPSIMAERALQLVNGHLLPHKPTHILIERQRWRTGGRAPVQECMSPPPIQPPVPMLKPPRDHPRQHPRSHTLRHLRHPQSPRPMARQSRAHTALPRRQLRRWRRRCRPSSLLRPHQVAAASRQQGGA